MMGSHMLWAIAVVSMVYGVSWWVLERWPQIGDGDGRQR